MGFIDNIRLALASLWTNKMRALLTMLGIIIGIGAVITIMTIGDSVSGTISDTMSSLGVNAITVSVTQKEDDSADTSETTDTTTASSSSSSSSSASAFSGSSSSGDVRMKMFNISMSDEDLITDDMVAAYRAAFPDEIAAISITESLGTATLTVDDDTVSATMTGVNADYQNGNDITLLSGRFVKDSDGERKVCVVADTFVSDVFGDDVTASDAVGMSFEAEVDGVTRTYYIVGVYQYDEDSSSLFSSSSSSDSSSDETVTTVYLPLDAAKALAGESTDTGYSSITVESASSDNSLFVQTTEDFFASYYTRNDSYTVEASSLESVTETVTEMISTVKYAISAIAAISLIVGGIGVMNIMLVSVTERTREIGTYKALGATRGAIRLQFITESVVICLIGGLLGIALGLGLGAILVGYFGYEAQPDVTSILAAVAFSTAIGIFFGYSPANKAAKLDPIESLRYE